MTYSIMITMVTMSPWLKQLAAIDPSDRGSSDQESQPLAILTPEADGGSGASL